MKKALIFGVGGQDGSYLADILLEKGYVVYGATRSIATQYYININHLQGKIIFLTADLLDEESLLKCIKESEPDEIYNLAGQSSVHESWKSPHYNSDVNGLGVLRLISAIRTYGTPVKYFQASTSEMFGDTLIGSLKCDESTQHNPKSPYAVAKSYAHNMTKLYREAYGMFNCCGIFFNHESERRGVNFITRKITNGVAKISLGLSDSITLGNIDIKKDWGYAPDYMEASWLMMQQETADDFIIATEQVYSMSDFLRIAFECIGISDWEKYIKQDKKLFRPTEFVFTPPDCSKIKNELKWEPKTSLKQMIEKMVGNDIKLLK